jgi:hypothetical protein
MLRSRARAAAGPYRVTFSSDAWKKIGLSPTATFQALQYALDSIASTLGARRPPGEGAQSELCTQVAGLLIIYQRDDATRTLTVVDFLPASVER